MFNIVERHQKLVKGIMVAITASFVVWGVSGYLGMAGDDGYVAKVGSNKIYMQDIDRMVEQNPQQNQDKMQVLFGLINRQLLINALDDNHLTATNQQLRTSIAAIPLFQTNGSFDPSKYEQFLKQRYMSSAKFEQDVKQQVLIEQMLDLFKNSYFTAHTFESQFANLLSRERNVSSYIIDPKQYYAQIKLSESDINNYYQQNLAKYTLADQVKLQYLTLSAAQLAAAIKVSDDEINQYLRDHPDSSNNEQVDVSHILFNVPADATPAQRQAIKDKAQKVLSEVRANPGKFAQLAKQYSQDPGSAAKGGDLGYFGHGVMVKPFEEVAFKLKPGQISDLVTTQFGFHILKLNAIKANDQALVRQNALKQLQKQKADKQLATSVDELNDLTYNKPDSLQPAAQKLGLSMQTSDWLAKDATSGLLANPKVQKAIFTDDVLKNKHNSEVVELGDGSYLVARVIDYKPARVKPLAEVRSQIVTELTNTKASQMAMATGQNNVKLLSEGKLKLKFSNPEEVTMLGQSKAIDAMAVRQIFAMPAKFPSYTGAVNSSGAYVIYQINGEATDKSLISQNQRMISQMADQYSMFTLNAYVGALRSQYKVTYKLDRINGANNDMGGAPAAQ